MNKKIKLTEEERIILKNIDDKWKYIARDMSGDLLLYDIKPIKCDEYWDSKLYTDFTWVNHLFPFIKWNDKEPYSIEELLKEEEENQ